jgi:peptidoglycan/LPS O-acetylase OafA/YrhL
MWLFVLKPLGLGNGAIFAALIVAGIPVILGVSYLFFRAFEMPFMNAPVPSRAPLPYNHPPQPSMRDRSSSSP